MSHRPLRARPRLCSPPAAARRVAADVVLCCSAWLGLQGPALAQAPVQDGPWTLRVACSAHATNKRPAFDWTTGVVVKGGSFTHRRSSADPDPAKAFEETWHGHFGDATVRGALSLDAKGSRPGGEPWELRFQSASATGDQVELAGGVHALDGGRDVRLRTCTAHLRRDAAVTTMTQAVTTAAPNVPATAAAGLSVLAAAVARAAPGAAQPAAVPASAARPAAPSVAVASATAATAAPAAAAAPAPAAARSVGPRSAAEIRKALYEDAGFDLALVAVVPGSGTLKRTLQGTWTTGRGTVYVSKRLVVASDIHYDLKGFNHLAAAERGATIYAGTYYQASLYHPNPVPGTESRGALFSGPAPKVSAGMPAGPAPRAAAPAAAEISPGKALDAALMQAIDKALTGVLGKPASFALDYETSGDLALVPRHKVDPAFNPPRVQGQWIARIERGEAEVLAYITQDQIRQGLKSHLQASQASDQRDTNLLLTLKNSAATGADGLIGSLSVRTGVNVKPCALKADLALAPFLLKHEPLGAWITDGAPKWSHEPPQGLDTPEELFEELKTGRRCSAVMGRGPLIAMLAAALHRDRIGHIVYPQPQPYRAVVALKAKALGFDDLAAFEFADSIGSRDPRQARGFRDQGVTTAAAVAQARERLKKHDARATDSLDVLLSLLQDEADARKQGTSIEKLQAARAEREVQQARVAAAAQKDADQRTAKEFPYVMTLRCRVGNNHIGIEPCLRHNGIDTELELRNGSDYHMYKVFDVQGLGDRGDSGTEVNLRSRFQVKVQNASSTAVLDMVIRERASGAVKYQQSGGHFKVLAVQN